MVSAVGVALNPDETETIGQWPKPLNKHKLSSFLEQIRTTGVTFQCLPTYLSNKYQKAFEELKRHATNTLILNHDIGCTLSQLNSEHERVTGYFSKVFSKAEPRHCVTRRKLLDIMKSTEHYYKYLLYGQIFLLRTVHATVKRLLLF